MNKLDQLRARYERAMHGMQAGVALDVSRQDPSVEPKHLRVGVNSALVDSGALADLLIKKGLITQEEYLTALAEAAEREHASHEAAHSARLGCKITLT